MRYWHQWVINSQYFDVKVNKLRFSSMWNTWRYVVFDILHWLLIKKCKCFMCNDAVNEDRNFPKKVIVGFKFSTRRRFLIDKKIFVCCYTARSRKNGTLFSTTNYIRLRENCNLFTFNWLATIKSDAINSKLWQI